MTDSPTHNASAPATDRGMTSSWALDIGVLTAGLLTAICVATGYTGPPRVVVAAVAASLLPGAAVLTRLTVADLTAWLGLAVVFSLTLEAVVSLALVWAGWWHPGIAAAVIGGLSAVVLCDDLRRSRARSSRAGQRAVTG